VPGFFGWVRENAQQHLLRDAQARVAQSLGIEPPPRHRSLFWTRVFVPVYRRTPWAVRRRVMVAMPGSHRRAWPSATPPSGPAV
jgi:hypothetical protein